MLRYAAVTTLARTAAAAAGRQPLQRTTAPLRLLSSTSDNNDNPGMFGRVQNAIQDRTKRNQQQEFASQLEKMSNSPKWTVGDFVEDLSKTVNSWRTKIPGLSSLDQVKTAKQVNSIAEAIVEEMGIDATSEKLMEMTRTQKLKVSLKSGASVEEINGMLQQFQAVDVMHQVVRKRKLEGKAIPSDEASMRQVMQVEGLGAMSKAQRKAMKQSRMKSQMRGMGGVGRPR